MEETARVNNLITELLDLVKTKKPVFQLDDLHDLIDKMVRLITPQTREKRIEIERQYDPLIEAIPMDPEKIKQVILNILSNASESTPEKGKIEIRTRKMVDEKGSIKVLIEITNDGPGIPEALIDKIFDPYFTTKHKSTMHSGTGLGLFIADQNVREHGGSIEAKSKLNKSATFTIILPADSTALASGEVISEQIYANR
jgi:signal transduction histidine kinase